MSHLRRLLWLLPTVVALAFALPVTLPLVARLGSNAVAVTPRPYRPGNPLPAHITDAQGRPGIPTAARPPSLLTAAAMTWSTSWTPTAPTRPL